MRDIHTIFFSDSMKMNKIKAIVDEVAKTDVTVLINGETGTGKELVAEVIHLNRLVAKSPSSG
jgi:transcriptional regulator with GAF, ATPase, and Fis domain